MSPGSPPKTKPDGSPVTQADLAADAIIVDGLKQLRPDIPVVSEERVDRTTGPYLASFFIVDPLDGTREFIAGHNDYTVNVALVTRGRPLLGVISAPALGLIWRGVVGVGAERMKLSAQAAERLASREPIRTRPSAGRQVGRGRQPLPPRQPDKCLHQAARRDAAADRIGAEVLPRRGRRCRYLSATFGDLRMGHRRRPRDPRSRRRPGHGWPRPAAALRRTQGRFRRAGVHRLGRSVEGAVAPAYSIVKQPPASLFELRRARRRLSPDMRHRPVLRPAWGCRSSVAFPAPERACGTLGRFTAPAAPCAKGVEKTHTSS